MPTGDPRTLSVLMPVHNEARTLRTIVRRVLCSPVDELGLEIQLLAVDDGSTDNSLAILRELAEADERITVLGQPRNMGKGTAVRAAIAEASGDIAIIQDSDLEYDPAEYPRVLAPILEGRADAVFGSRFAASGQRRVLHYWHSQANRWLTRICNALNDIDLTDMETCYKAVRMDVLKQLPLKSTRFGIEPEITTRLAQWNARIYEVPISYHARSYAEGKSIGWWDAVKALALLVRFRFLDTRFSTHEGYYLLEGVRRARKYNRWTLDQIEPFIGQRVLEAGCGIGNFTEQLLTRERLVCADDDALFADVTRRRFEHLDSVRVERLDLGTPSSYAILGGESLDTIIAMNVLEHAQDDAAIVRAFHDLLPPGGRLIVLAPAHPSLASKMDDALGHVRRYPPDDLRDLLARGGFEVESARRFNKLGGLGWWVWGRLGRSRLSPKSVRLFDHLITIAKLVERVPGLPSLSVIAIGRKPVSAAEARPGPGATVGA
ncbi:MAG: glycosyltransferase [Planctomycetota bacterium]